MMGFFANRMVALFRTTKKEQALELKEGAEIGQEFSDEESEENLIRNLMDLSNKKLGIMRAKQKIAIGLNNLGNKKTQLVGFIRKLSLKVKQAPSKGRMALVGDLGDSNKISSLRQQLENEVHMLEQEIQLEMKEKSIELKQIEEELAIVHQEYDEAKKLLDLFNKDRGILSKEAAQVKKQLSEEKLELRQSIDELREDSVAQEKFRSTG